MREMDRTPSLILDTCDREGSVKIRRRNGQEYTLVAGCPQQRVIQIPDLRSRVKRIFPEPLSPEQVAAVDKLIAGE